MIKNKIIFLLLSLFLYCSSFNILKANDPGALTIFSESNMTYALAKVARYYSVKENVAISVDFNSSFELIENIDLGEPADIFISSHIDWVKDLTQKGLVDRYSSVEFAQDSLVLVTSKNNKKIKDTNISELESFKDVLTMIKKNRIPLIVGSEFSSLGRYSETILAKSKISNFQIFRKLDEDKKSITDFIDNHPEYCAIVMESDVKNDDNITILGRVPKIKINYHALVIAGDNMGNARDFIQYLRSDEAKSILLEFGFLI